MENAQNAQSVLMTSTSNERALKHKTDDENAPEFKQHLNKNYGRKCLTTALSLLLH